MKKMFCVKLSEGSYDVKFSKGSIVVNGSVNNVKLSEGSVVLRSLVTVAL